MGDEFGGVYPGARGGIRGSLDRPKNRLNL